MNAYLKMPCVDQWSAAIAGVRSEFARQGFGDGRMRKFEICIDPPAREWSRQCVAASGAVAPARSFPKRCGAPSSAADLHAVLGVAVAAAALAAAIHVMFQHVCSLNGNLLSPLL